MYSVPFEAVNFEPSGDVPMPIVAEYKKAAPLLPPPDQKMEIDSPAPPSPFQGNIVTTKPDAVKKSAIATSQNQINPMLVANNPLPNPPKTASLEDSGTIVRGPSDKPINLDMNAFLGETQKTKRILIS